MPRHRTIPAPAPPLVARACAALRAAGADAGAKVVVALSGGADSVALLFLLEEVSRSCGLSLRLTAAHLHHGLRGAEADEDLDFVRALAAGRGHPLVELRADVNALSRAEKIGIEAAGRRARYGFLLEAAGRVGARFVATGHTRDDQAETVLFRIRRGAGLKGLAGILPFFPLDPETDVVAVRPLLAVSREEIVEFLRSRGAAWREDSSNEDPRFARNRIRLGLLPFLRQARPGIDSALVSLAEAAWALRKRGIPEEGAPLSGAHGTDPCGIILTLDEYLEGGPDFSRSLRRAFALAGGIPERLRRPHYRILERMVRGEGPPGLDLPGSIPATAVPGGVRFGGGASGAAAGIEEAGLFIPGRLSCGAYEVHARYASPAELDLGTGRRDRGPEFVDAAAVLPPLVVRSAAPGDRIHPLGAPGRKRLKEHLRAFGIPAGERKARPLVVDGSGRVVWVAGGGIAHWARVTGQTERAIRFDFRTRP